MDATFRLVSIPMKSFLQLSGAIALLAVAAFFGTLSWATAQIPRKIDGIRADLNDQMTFARVEAAKQIEAARMDALALAGTQLVAIRTETMQRLDAVVSMTDRRTGDLLKIADSARQDAAGSIAGLRVDLIPTLSESAALLKDARDSWDDLYPDVKGTVASATVAVTSAAQASESIRDAAPQVARSVVGIGKSADAIAGDVRRTVDEATKPKRWWQKLLGPIYTAVRLLGALL